MEKDGRSFVDLSTDVVIDFLQNVILVDDNAKYEISSGPKPTHLSKPRKRGKRTEEESSNNDDKQTSKANQSPLNAKEVIDSFAKKGIVCSVIRPNDSDDPWEEVGTVIKRADALILDWEINDTGENATEIIRRIILEDLDNGPRLRLIIVYTQENDLQNISKTIQVDLNKSKIQLNLNDRGYTLSLNNHLRIVIYAKEDVFVGDEDVDRVVDYQKLPDVMIKEFAKITTGLISNVALESLAVLRRNTPLILGKLGPEMDPPYLTHRAWLPIPDDAMDFATNIICSEFYSILDHAEVGQKANLEAIEAWLKYKGYGEKVKLYFLNKKTEVMSDEVSFEDFMKYLNIGVESFPEQIPKKRFKSFTMNYCQEHSTQSGQSDENLEKKANELNCKFTMVTCLQYQYGGNGNKPVLTSGTILKELKSGKYWLCLQPKCDCVRIDKDKEDGKRNFFFLELLRREENENFDLVLKNIEDYKESDGDTFVKFCIHYKIYNSALFNFEANYNNRVRWSESKDKKYYFVTSDGQDFVWISEIKSDYVQKITNNFAAEISRVGLDEFEWSRRLAP